MPENPERWISVEDTPEIGTICVGGNYLRHTWQWYTVEYEGHDCWIDQEYFGPRPEITHYMLISPPG